MRVFFLFLVFLDRPWVCSSRKKKHVLFPQSRNPQKKKVHRFSSSATVFGRSVQPYDIIRALIFSPFRFILRQMGIKLSCSPHFHTFSSMCVNSNQWYSQPSASRRTLQFPWYRPRELSLPAVTVATPAAQASVVYGATILRPCHTPN